MRLALSARYSQRGVTLLENMVALLILSVGLLGMAGLQVFTLRGESSTTFRLRAMQQAQDMADRMRSNIGAIYNNPNGPQYTNISPSSVPAAKDCMSTLCDATELAAYDIEQWQTLNNELLPGKAGVVGGYIQGQPLTNNAANIPLYLDPTTVVPNRMRYVITMVWDGERTGSALPPTCLDSTSNSPLSCYVLVVDL